MSRQNSAALRSTKSTTPIRAVQAPTTTPRPPATGVSDFMTGTPQQQAAAGLFGSAAQQRAQAGSLGAAMGFTQPTAPAPPAGNLVMQSSGGRAPVPSSGAPGGIPGVTSPASDSGQRSAQPFDFRDSSYNSQIAAIERALRDFETGAATRGQRYEQDFTTGLQRLGFNPAPQAMAARGADGVSVGPLQGEFDIEGAMDRTSAAARGTRGMRDDFAGRGTLRSSDFVNSFDDFQNRLQQQLTGMETGRTRFGQDLSTELSQFQTRAQEQRAAAEAEAQNRALMRSLSQMGF